MIVIAILNVLFRGLKVKNKNIVVMMTFPKDVLPIIEQLSAKGYKLTVITTDKHAQYIQHLSNVTYVKAGNKNVIKHIKLLSTAKIILIDTYYLIMGHTIKSAANCYSDMACCWSIKRLWVNRPSSGFE